MKRIKTFNQLFESISDDRIELYNYLEKCLCWRGTHYGSKDTEEVGIKFFPNFDAEDTDDYKVNGIKTLRVITNTHFNWGSISYAFTEALNPNPNEKILGCFPGTDLSSMISSINFIIGDSMEAKSDYIEMTEDGTQEFEVSGDNNYIFKFIIEKLIDAFSKYGDSFFMTYVGTDYEKLHLPEYSKFINDYLQYLVKLNVGDPINYNVHRDIDEYFKKNPLDIYKIDNLERFKQGVLDRTGIKDFGKIGSALRNGLI
jgi:hypothetical protein